MLLDMLRPGSWAQFDPLFLATRAPAAAVIKIGPGEKNTQDLVIR